jgi:hypothetical protein
VEPLPYQLEIEPMDLGADVKAVGLELIKPESREPVRGPAAARAWAAVLTALAGDEPWALDFFSHADRVRDYCVRHSVGYRDASPRSLVVAPPEAEELEGLFARFEGETFGVRAGGPLATGDAALEPDLARRGVDAYHPAYGNYLFCAVCDFENGFLTLLTNRLWASEVIRRVRPALDGLPVSISRPH